MGAEAPEPPAPPGAGRRFLHLAALSGFLVAEPVFLATNPTLFASYGSAPVDVFVAATLLVVLPPALLLGVEELAGLRSEGWRDRLHIVFVGGLAAVGGSTLLLGSAGTVGRLVVALAAGIGFALAYRRFGGLRRVLTAVSPAPLLFLALYLFVGSVSDFTLASEEGIEIEDVRGRAPVVMIVLDELPTTSLLDARERIDARRYPNFARLARGSDWFRNATTVHWETHRAVPALVSARRARPGDVPAAIDYRDNLFTLLGGGYEVHAEEPYARMCPRAVCRRHDAFPERLADLTANLALVSAAVAVPDGVRHHLSIPGPREADQGDPSTQLDRFVGRLGLPARGARPRLDYVHALLPHVPWERMPSGRRYPTEEEALVGLKGTEKWSDDPERLRENHQRHLLQLAYTDRELGRVLDKLKASGAYDRSLVVVVADHGASFKPGEQRREANDDTAEEIMPVPFFVKRPGQRRGRVIDRHVETLDVVPTIADVLGIEIPFAVEGQSALGPRRESVPTIHLESGKRVTMSLGELERRRRAVLGRQLALFGTGPVEPTLFNIGPRRELVGRPVAAQRTVDGELEAEIREREDLEDVDRSGDLLPTRISGRLSEGGSRSLAVALNGFVVATTRTRSDGDGDQFAALVPERALRNGGNEVKLFEIGRPGEPLREIAVD